MVKNMNVRRRISFTIMLVCIGLSSSSLAQRADEDGDAPPTLSYRCEDLVVVGRLVTESSENIPDSIPFPDWQARWHFRITIKQVIRGNEGRPEVTATAVAHVAPRSDRDLLIFLRPTKGAATLCRAPRFGQRVQDRGSQSSVRDV
jgi:hypothetical protein